MSKLTIEINTDNSAFWNEDSSPTDEVARILAGIADSYPYSGMNADYPVRDINGTTVGHWRIEP